MHFNSCTVRVYSAKKCCMICAVNPPTLTFLEFYKEQVCTVVTMVPSRRLNFVFVGKLCTSEVDQNLTVVNVSHCAGSIFKFYVEPAHCTCTHSIFGNFL